MRSTVLALSAAVLFAAAPAWADPPDRVVTYTGQNGGGFTAVTDAERDPAAGTFTVDRDITFNDGSTRSVDTVGVRTAPGAADLERTVTRRNGETVVQTGSVAVVQDPNGRTVTADWEGPNGAAQSTRQVTRGAGVRTSQTDTVFDDGSTRSSSSTLTRTGPGQATVDQTVTGRNGGVRQRHGSVTVDRRP